MQLHTANCDSPQVWFQNQRAKWRRSLLRQASSGPQVVQECRPLAELAQPISRFNSNLNGSTFTEVSYIQENYDSDGRDEDCVDVREEEQAIATYRNLY